jgi:hypothetical protein
MADRADGDGQGEPLKKREVHRSFGRLSGQSLNVHVRNSRSRAVRNLA